MRTRLAKITIYLLILLTGIASGIFISKYNMIWSGTKKPYAEPQLKPDNTKETPWSKDFEMVNIQSSMDHTVQKAYFFRAKSVVPKPLIVSLHTWSGYFDQYDALAELCKEKDVNYIHPDFRGANLTKDACCSELALNDIDDAITWAIQHADVDAGKIFVMGTSGGGYATLCTFMKSKHKISKFSAWASISDLIAWYNESEIRGNKYARNILDCTESENELNIENARKRSPIYWDTPVEKRRSAELYIYAGVYDGIQGSVPITHSINFYNKLLTDLSETDTLKYVTPSEKLFLLEFRKPTGAFGSIADRNICLKKEHENIRLVIFEGNHEMLKEFALNELLEDQ